MSKKAAKSWIMAYDGSNPDYPFFGFACLRCGAEDHLPNSLPVDAFLARIKTFIGIHSHCKTKTKK